MDKPMEHLKQWHDCYQGTLTANETALYINIFMIANRRRWPEWVEITDAQLAFIANIRERTIPDIINSLVQRGLIVSKRKKGKAPSAYQIVDLSPSYYVKNDVINPRYIRDKSEISPRYIRDKSEISPRLEENSPCESKDREAPKTKTKTTQHKDKDIKNNIGARAKFVPPTLDEVNAYIMEKGLHVSAKEFLDYFEATGWVDAKGQRVKSWKGKLLTWEKFQPQKKTRAEESQAAADRAIAFFEKEERNGEGSGDNPPFEAVFPSVPESGNA